MSDSTEQPVRADAERERVQYNLSLSREVYDELKKRADAKDCTVAALVRSFLKLGLVVVHLEEHPDCGEFVLRQGGVDKSIVLI